MGGFFIIRVLALAAADALCLLAPAVANADCGADHTAQASQPASTDLAAKKKAAPATTDGKGNATQHGAVEVAARPD